MPVPQSFLSVFPQAEGLLALTPGDLCGVMIEIAPSLVNHSGMFTVDAFLIAPHPPLIHRHIRELRNPLLR
jgi:hypothetical protein